MRPSYCRLGRLARLPSIVSEPAGESIFKSMGDWSPCSSAAGLLIHSAKSALAPRQIAVPLSVAGAARLRQSSVASMFLNTVWRPRAALSRCAVPETIETIPNLAESTAVTVWPGFVASPMAPAKCMDLSRSIDISGENKVIEDSSRRPIKSGRMRRSPLIMLAWSEDRCVRGTERDILKFDAGTRQEGKRRASLGMSGKTGGRSHLRGKLAPQCIARQSPGHYRGDENRGCPKSEDPFDLAIHRGFRSRNTHWSYGVRRVAKLDRRPSRGICIRENGEDWAVGGKGRRLP